MSGESESDPIGSQSAQSVDNDSVNSTTDKKRKDMVPRSVVWKHFTRFIDDKGLRKAKCNYCDKPYSADPKTCGTATLKNHMISCKANPYNHDLSQTKITGYQQSGGSETGVNVNVMGTWRFECEAVRKALGEMLITDELLFSFVDRPGFRRFVSVALPPDFSVPSRRTISRDCYDLYIQEKSKLKMWLKDPSRRVCLTTDTWTSLQRINYMVLTTHFIDNNWILHKKILNFCPIKSHKGEDIGIAVEKCLLDWGIDKVLTITVDNTSSNDVGISYLKKRFDTWGTNVLGGKYLHMRCVAHIINLVVVDGVKEVGESVARVRGAVRFVRQSPARLRRFKECVEFEKIESKKLLCLDVPTRWNSTYLMLDTPERFERAFERYNMQDSNYKLDLSDSDGKGLPSEEDWTNVRRLVRFLEHFYHLTLRISGSLYVTLNSFLTEISELYCLLKEWQSSNDFELSYMATKMKAKYDKYWGDPEKMNLLIFIAMVLDPRHKLGFLDFVILQMYGKVVGQAMGKLVRDGTYQMFNEYKRLNSPQSTASSSSHTSSGRSNVTANVEPQKRRKTLMKKEYDKYKVESGNVDAKSELDRYLGEAVEDDDDDFDILKWWKVNSPRFPILAQMARDVLAVPISTVASESAFSTGGRVLDAFRSSLTPRLVQAIVCAQDWLRPQSRPVSVEEDLDNLEKIEEDLLKIANDSNNILDL